jgi:outer membrane protein assembly factor BamE (lipoprotein component of BamABCDE complex)
MRKAIAVVFSCLLIAGCGVARKIESRQTNDRMMSLQVGMGRADVLQLLGNPYKREAYGQTEFLIYETDYAGGRSESDNFTPIAIENGRVAGWGRNYYDNSIKQNITVQQR